MSNVSSAVFSPDGKRVVTASQDRTARVWEVATGKVLLILEGHTRAIQSAVFGPDGKRVVTVSDDETVRVWSADPLPIAIEYKPRHLTPVEMDTYEVGTPAEREAYRRKWEQRYQKE